MSPDDPRHGEYRGAVAHWLDGERPCEPCARAEWRYRKTRKLRHLRGDAPMVPAIGTLRRVQALHAIGWTGPQIATEAGVSVNSMRSIGYHGSSTVRAVTATRIADAYERLSMTWPEGHYANRSRSIARRRGWLPPLAWIDIDDPDERPDLSAVDDLPDPVVVERILAGDWGLKATPTERAEVCQRWYAAGRSLAELERLTGWRPDRYFKVEESAA